MGDPTQAVTVTHLGCPGHLIVADRCRWRRHTQIDGPGGSFRVSTVGDFYPERNGPRETIGCDGNFFESMAFATAINGRAKQSDGCGCRPVLTFANPIATQRYRTAGEAQAGHETMVARFAERAAKSLEVL